MTSLTKLKCWRVETDLHNDLHRVVLVSIYMYLYVYPTSRFSFVSFFCLLLAYNFLSDQPYILAVDLCRFFLVKIDASISDGTVHPSRNFSMCISPLLQIRDSTLVLRSSFTDKSSSHRFSLIPRGRRACCPCSYSSFEIANTRYIHQWLCLTHPCTMATLNLVYGLFPLLLCDSHSVKSSRHSELYE